MPLFCDQILAQWLIFSVLRQPKVSAVGDQKSVQLSESVSEQFRVSEQ